ncbi:hypothetical protein APT56_16945 [Achromobacter denitrificans]|nr:hypothetical protein APT56_16945 [Achromobacter denitrificans]
MSSFLTTVVEATGVVRLAAASLPCKAVEMAIAGSSMAFSFTMVLPSEIIAAAPIIANAALPAVNAAKLGRS